MKIKSGSRPGSLDEVVLVRFGFSFFWYRGFWVDRRIVKIVWLGALDVWGYRTIG